jgi:DNA-binding beta-propeller fold protein YncE
MALIVRAVLLVLFFPTAVLGATVAPVHRPFGLAIAPNGLAWVEQYNDSLIDVLGLRTGQIKATVPAAPNPTRPAFFGDMAIYSSEYGHAIHALDIRTYRTDYTIPIASPVIANVAIGPDGLGYATTDPGAIVVFNPANGTLLHKIMTSPRPRGLAWSAGGQVMATVSKSSGVMDIFSMTPGKPLKFAAPIGASPRDVTFQKGFAYAPNFKDGTVSKVNWRTGASVTIDVGGQPRRIIAGDNRIFVADQRGKVIVLNPRTDQITRTIDVGSQIRDMALGPKGKRLFVSGYGNNALLSFRVGGGHAPNSSGKSVAAGPHPSSNVVRRVGVNLWFDLIVWKF